nr:PREDICTED: NAD-dependent protein deacetylase sirtuin-1 [Bemisia tabaci]
MGSSSEDLDYLSPAKRIKLENSDGDQNLVSAPNLGTCASSAYTSKEPGNQNGDSDPFVELKNTVEEGKPSGQSDLNNDRVEEEEEASDDDEVSSTVSNWSDITGLSDISGQDWKCFAGPMTWIQNQIISGVNPRDLLNDILDDATQVPPQVPDFTLWKLLANMMCCPPRRKKLEHINTLDDVVNLIKTCSRIMVLTGAGVSVSCGIPDFRSHNGIYSRLAIDFPNLPDPQAMFDINYFRKDPRPFFKFAREIYPGQFKPSPCHRFIKMLENRGKLLRNYTQNIDTLEKVAGINNIIECHGSFSTASCMNPNCSNKVTSEDIREDVFAQNIPMCQVCKDPSGVIKPDIVFFGEGLPESFHSAMAEDKNVCDLLIVIGSSLKVRPVALIPNSLPSGVPQILINRERLPHLTFDVELLGDGDVVVDTICRMLGEDFSEICWRETPCTAAERLNSPILSLPFRSENGADCSEGEMSIDSTRDSGLGGSSRGERQTSIDSCMEEDSMDGKQFEPLEPCSSTNQSESAPCADCPPIDEDLKCCEYINRLHHTARRKSTTSREAGTKHILFDDNVQETLISCAESDSKNKQRGMLVDEPSSSCSSNQVPSSLVVQRHMSLDSTRDSGIGDGSNSSHSATTDRHMSVDSHSPDTEPISNESSWEREKISVAARLPENTYFMLKQGRYIFPGAEVYSNPMERSNSRSSLSSTDSNNSQCSPPI